MPHSGQAGLPEDSIDSTDAQTSGDLPTQEMSAEEFAEWLDNPMDEYVDFGQDDSAWKNLSDMLREPEVATDDQTSVAPAGTFNVPDAPAYYPPASPIVDPSQLQLDYGQDLQGYDDFSNWQPTGVQAPQYVQPADGYWVPEVPQYVDPGLTSIPGVWSTAQDGPSLTDEVLGLWQTAQDGPSLTSEVLPVDPGAFLPPLPPSSPPPMPPPSKRRRSPRLQPRNSPAGSTATPEPGPAVEAPAPRAPKKMKPQADPDKPWVKINKVTKGKNARSANINNLNPADYYEPLPQAPASWGGSGGYQRPTFNYTEKGELIPGTKFSASQIVQFIRDHPHHQIAGQPLDAYMFQDFPRPEYLGIWSGKESPLELWVQVAPADSVRRYPAENSDKCRFRECPVKHNSIAKGTFRVAFDESAVHLPRVLDPFHQAGYVHLYCLERFCDFPTICQLFNVKPDDRILPEGKNRMAISRDHEEFVGVVERWMRRATPKLPDAPFVYEDTLCYKLTMRHLEYQSGARQKAREQRAGNSLDVHLGNLEVYAEGERAKIAKKQKAPKAPRKKPSPKGKRKRAESDEEDSGLDSDVLEDPGPRKRARTTDSPRGPRTRARTTESPKGKRKRVSDDEASGAESEENPRPRKRGRTRASRRDSDSE